MDRNSQRGLRLVRRARRSGRTRMDALRVTVVLLWLWVVPARVSAGDCTADMELGKRIALGNETVATCPGFDRDGDGRVSIDELLAAGRAPEAQIPPAAALTSTAPAILVGSISGAPGQQVSFSVTLSTGGAIVAGTQNDISFDPNSIPVAAIANGKPDCHVNPDINKNGTSFAFRPPGCSGSGCTGMRALVLALDNIDPIPDGSVLYTCNVAVAPGAVGGDYPLTISGVILSSPQGVRVDGATGTNGSVTVSAGTASCAGDCNDDGLVTLGDVVTVINLFLRKEPISSCSAADVNQDGRVSIGEIVRTVNVLLGNLDCTVPPPDTCGNGIVDTGEDCDDGGTCIGGSNAGTACTAENQCQGDGVCTDGANASRACTFASDCPGGSCRHCVPQGGDGCAANCTSESAVPLNLVPGVVDQNGISVKSGTSGAVVHGDALTIPLPLTGAEAVVVGKPRNGSIPMVVPADSVQFPQIDVSGLACSCVRGVAAKTCGGTTFTKTGELAKDCTPGYSNNGDAAHDGPCPANLPCTFIHGAGNSAAGALDCDGRAGINLLVTQDDVDGSCNPGPCSSPPTRTTSGQGGPGSGVLLTSTSIGTAVGACTASFCTDADAFSVRGVIGVLPLTTGAAQGEFSNANGIPDDTVCECATGDPACSASLCIQPVTVQGAQLTCDNLSNGLVSGATLVGAFTFPNVPIVGDSVVTTVFVVE